MEIVVNQLNVQNNSIHDEEEEISYPTADYRGLFHGWECPECQTLGFCEEDVDPREVGIYVECRECGWKGKVE